MASNKNSSSTTAVSNPPELPSGISLALDWAAILVATATTCILPWLLGGVIPKAQLVLQVGTIAAAFLTLLARLVSRRPFAMPPLGTWLLLGMAGIGFIQLQPWMPSAISLMNHSVHPEFRSQLPGTDPDSATTAPRSSTPADSRSAAPALTRRHVAQWIAVAMLLCVVADSISRGSQVVFMLSLMCINACAMTILSLLQTFAGSRWLSEPWIVTNISSFGSFVNPNNAAGWLLVHMAIAIGLVVIAWGKTPIKGHSRPFGSSAWQERRNTFALSIRLRLASLNSRQVLSVVTVVLLLTGVAATVSRGGIVAAISCLLICAALRRSLLSLLSCSLLLAGVFFVLTALEFDSRVISELGTLESPLTEGISRTDHWSDSLTSVRDFPLLGSGQGAYAWSTRPYLRHGDLNWFRNADNQYVEVVVESGLLGLTFFVGFGIWLTVASIRLIAAETKTHPHQGWWPEPGGIGLAGLALITSQGIAVFFDFGIGHCSTIAAIAVVSGTLAAVVRSRRPSSQSAPAWYSPSGMLMGLSLRIAMVIAASTAVPELRHMDQIDPAITESARLLDSPVTRPALARLPVLNRQFSEALERYPDHPIVRMSLLRVVEARFRLQLIDQLSPVDAPLEDRELQNAWRQLTPVSLPDRIAIARTQLAPADFSHLQTSIKANLRDFPWHELARDMSRQMPLEPGIAVQSAAGYVSIGKLKDEQLQELNAVLFTDPAGARNLFLCGVLCLLEGRMQQTEAFWQQSLVVSERFRVAVLQNALRYLPQDQTLEMFAPREYLTTVNTALARISPELQAELFTLAESQWLSVRNNPTREQRVQRAVHLIHEEEPDVALKWIDGCLAEFPDLLELRPLRANCLEKQGKLGEAIGEWMRYEHFDPTNPQTAKTIKRLKKLQDN